MVWSDVSRVHFPQRMLWLSVLRRAVFDFVLYKGARRHRIEWQTANKFIFETACDEGDGLTFEQVCGLFGWTPEAIRRRISKLERSDIRKLESTKLKDDFPMASAYYKPVHMTWETAIGSAPSITMAPVNVTKELAAELRSSKIDKTVTHQHLLMPIFG